jgi:hypothetical protein
MVWLTLQLVCRLKYSNPLLYLEICVFSVSQLTLQSVCRLFIVLDDIFAVPDHAFLCLSLIVDSMIIFRSNVWTEILSSFRTASGTFKDGELRLNQRGLQLISEENGDENVSSWFSIYQWLLLLFVYLSNWFCLSFTSIVPWYAFRKGYWCVCHWFSALRGSIASINQGEPTKYSIRFVIVLMSPHGVQYNMNTTGHIK